MSSLVRVSSKKLLRASQGRTCSYCEKQCPTVVRAHYTGLRQHAYGKGRGIKGSDLASADLCQSCHSDFDNLRIGEGKTLYEKKVDQSEQFLHCIMVTLHRDWEQGIIRE